MRRRESEHAKERAKREVHVRVTVTWPVNNNINVAALNCKNAEQKASNWLFTWEI